MKEIKADAFTKETTSGSNLPPAGHKRREELAKRTDALQEKAEKLASEREVGSIPQDHAALDPEQNREIQYNIRKGYLDIGIDHPYYKTKWVNYVNTNGQKIWEAKAEGWQVSTATDFPEARDLSREDGTIRVGDVLLMHIRIDQYQQLEQKAKQRAIRQQYGIEAEIHDLAQSVNRAKGQSVFAGVSTPEIGVTGTISQNTQQNMEIKNAAQKTVMNHLGNKMKEGLIPGVPLR